MSTTEKIVIVGAGPAGYTAAIYAARANLSPLMYTGLPFAAGEETGAVEGGQLTTTSDVENYPGFAESVDGNKLVQEMKAQCMRFGTRVEQQHVTKIEPLGSGGKSGPFKITHTGGEVTAAAVVIATGANARYLDHPDVPGFRNRGVTACATCDGHFYKDMEVAVIGGGDSAVEESSYLTGLCPKVHLIHRRDELRASKIMADRAKANAKIQIHWDSVVENIKPNEHGNVGGMTVKNVKTGKVTELPIRGVFMAIGHTPSTKFLKGLLDLDDAGYILVKGTTTYTNVEGIFAAGDCVDKTYRQAVTAAGMGCMAAIDAERWLGAKGAH
jgi:thioredoxin reductase (NADPH)